MTFMGDVERNASLLGYAKTEINCGCRSAPGNFEIDCWGICGKCSDERRDEVIV